MPKESHIEADFIQRLQDQKYNYRTDIRDRESLEKNFREKFEALNRVKLSDNEFDRLIEEIERNDYKLNITRYASTAEAEKQISLKQVNKKIKITTDLHKSFLSDLGLDEI